MQRVLSILILSQVLWISVTAHAADEVESFALQAGEWLVRLQVDRQRSQASLRSLDASDRLLPKAKTTATLARRLINRRPSIPLDGGQYIGNTYLVRAKNYVRIPFWYGRLGNNLHQMFHAIRYAESQNISEVRNPFYCSLKDCPLVELFNLPGRFDVQPRASSKADCGFDSEYFLYKDVETCVLGYAKEDFRRVLMTYVKPHLWRHVSEACQSKDKASQDLVIHLRGGDLRLQNHPQARMQPCSFYRHLITTHNFSSVKLVVEDGEHDRLCRKYLLTALTGSKVRIKETKRSLIDDVCTLMTSQYLAFGLSTFPEALSMMNDRIKKIYVPALKFNGAGDIQYGSKTDISGAVECGGHFRTCTTGFIEYELYDIPGFEEVRVGHAKDRYLLQEKMAYHHLKTCGHCVGLTAAVGKPEVGRIVPHTP